MPDISWNQRTWNGAYDWAQAGEEWSGPWGSSAAEWFGTIMPRIGSALPCESVLEIAPGFGRWSRFLHRYCRTYVGVDLSAECVAACKKRFPGREYYVNDGKSLEAVKGRRFDFIYSFDSLVHADMDAIEAYVPQVIPLLAPGGVAFIHHSNLGAHPGVSYGHRSENVSAESFTQLVLGAGGKVLCRERVAWGEIPATDCFTLFCREGDFEGAPFTDLQDAGLLGVEAGIAAKRFRYFHTHT